ncbi:hypothetical protein E0E50_11870 [Azotobacter chroococcum subsp. isscasi]|uniref:hypothetical protein n=1 Tax=Azotobacter chroococcum TaxID=353 RepID=UPI00103F37B1|nr:hypothetical protein [Azotobacter chroococcum]TBW09544.1 hypothetical protein E0E50_11870 [Azotobacter chroococcum subsp. isscasi]
MASAIAPAATGAKEIAAATHQATAERAVPTARTNNPTTAQPSKNGTKQKFKKFFLKKENKSKK